jgi:hypothetical protein
MVAFIVARVGVGGLGGWELGLGLGLSAAGGGERRRPC